MKLLFDLFPVILFFATFKYSEKNPEAAAGWMNALLGGAVDVKQAPILLATVRFRPAAQLLGVVPRIALTHPTRIQHVLKIIVDFLHALSFSCTPGLHRCHPTAVSR